MAESALRDIYRAIEQTNVLLPDGTPVRVRGLDNLATQVTRANLPLRLLLPVGSNANGRNLSIITADGGGRSAVWTIPEIALLRPVSAGQGLEEAAGELVDYVTAYEAAILARRTAFTGFIINNIAIDTGELEWPRESGSWYFGVSVTLTVTELI